MKLYFAPLSCSLATRIALYEKGVDVEFVEVDTTTKLLRDGGDYRAIHPLGLVPALDLGNGLLLTESAAILQYIADRVPGPSLAPTDPAGRTELHRWLSFVGAELHKRVFNPFFDAEAPPEAKAYALGKAPVALDHAAAHLEGREYLLDAFSVADAYLFSILTWTVVTPVDLKLWPTLVTYAKRVRARAAVARALEAERVLYERRSSVTSADVRAAARKS